MTYVVLSAGHPQYAETFRPNCLFIGSNMRQAVNEVRRNLVYVVKLLLPRGLDRLHFATVTTGPRGLCAHLPKRDPTPVPQGPHASRYCAGAGFTTG